MGPGGIGKTTVAIAAAEQMTASFADGIWFVPLATLVERAAAVDGFVLGDSDVPNVLEISAVSTACLWLWSSRRSK